MWQERRAGEEECARSSTLRRLSHSVQSSFVQRCELSHALRRFSCDTATTPMLLSNMPHFAAHALCNLLPERLYKWHRYKIRQ